jgi:phenylpyruvate tautomerase PptA (4-oxalocrotonate tautomerase family)
MPILEIEIVTRPGEVLRPKLANELADRLGEIFASTPGSTWVRLHNLPADSYAENNLNPDGTPFPVFVSILKSNLPSAEDMQSEVARLTPAIAELCDRPSENVHLLYLPPGAGRVSFGGQLVT